MQYTLEGAPFFHQTAPGQPRGCESPFIDLGRTSQSVERVRAERSVQVTSEIEYFSEPTPV